jgi:hypothetical protein
VRAGIERPEKLLAAYQVVGSNPLRSDLMKPAKRLDEVAEILAAGLMRLRARQSSRLSADGGESSLDCPAHQSGHANVLKRPGGLD